MQVHYINGFGEDCTEDVYAEFTDPEGKQWVVTRCWRLRGPVVLPRESVRFITTEMEVA